MHYRHRLVLALLLLIPQVAAAQSDDSLWNRSIEELMQIEIVSVGKKEQRVFDSAASVYVVSRDEIRRSGLTTVPELLRLAPGVMVSRIDQSKWAVSVRGFNGRFSNKLLVMIDGRSLYNRMFAGVFWDALAVPVTEIERIEVIRGPGASVWGTNAVNGVINIVTRAAGDAPGTSVVVRSGLGERAAVDMAHSHAGANGGVRIFGRVSDSQSSDFDEWREAMGGIRAERGRAGGRLFTFQANAARSNAGQRSLRFDTLASPGIVADDVRADTNTYNAVATLTLPDGARGAWQFIGSADSMERHEPRLFRYSREIFEANLQHRTRSLRRQEIVWGTGIRSTRDFAETEGPTLARTMPRQSETLFNAFAQDEVTLAKDLRVTVGTKVEHTGVTGWNLQPSLRVWWSPREGSAVWGALSRALRTPSWTDQSVRFHSGADDASGPLPMLFAWVGNPEAGNETLDGYEAGFRATVHERFSLDVSGFYNRYTGLLVATPRQPQLELSPFGPHLLVPITPGNLLDATTAGAETVATLALPAHTSLTGTVEVFRRVDWTSADPTVTPELVNGDAPSYQWSLRTTTRLRGFEYDASLFRTGALSSPFLPAYFRLDGQISHPLPRGVELSLIGQNLLGHERRELVRADLVDVGSFGRSVALRAAWRFGR